MTIFRLLQHCCHTEKDSIVKKKKQQIKGLKFQPIDMQLSSFVVVKIEL